MLYAHWLDSVVSEPKLCSYIMFNKDTEIGSLLKGHKDSC